MMEINDNIDLSASADAVPFEGIPSRDTVSSEEAFDREVSENTISSDELFDREELEFSISSDEFFDREESDHTISQEEISEGEEPEETEEEETVSGTLVPSDTLSMDEIPSEGIISRILSGELIWPLVICIVLAVLAAGAAIFALMKRKKKTKRSITENVPGAIPLQLQVYAGKIYIDGNVIYLSDYILIGSGDDCDLRMAGEGVEPVHARIYRQNGQVHIEDMKSQNGVAIGGMLIQDHNPVRSGDVISIGEVDFSLSFTS